MAALMRFVFPLWLVACESEPLVPVEICDNSRDDDGDSLFDCADSDCLGQCPESCVDSLDNDGDGLVDCTDPDCDGLCPEDCFDGRDNDGDLLSDCADADCVGFCPEDCSDGRDNDGDGLFDCLDPDCNDPACIELCSDGRDNDGDGLADCADPSCDGACPEVCGDGRDNDGDTLLDCFDPDCDGSCPESCTDGRDNDGDGDVDCADLDCAATCDQDGDGFADLLGGGTDCDDSDAAVHPAAAEVCNGVDDDCDGGVDDADSDLDPSTKLPLYGDADGDGYGPLTSVGNACAPGPGQVLVGGDCDDDDPARSPGESEVCDGLDNDCDTLVDDDDPSIDPAQQAEWFYDLDNDGYGDPLDSVLSCVQPTDHVANSDDCHVFDPAYGLIVEWWPDNDGDGHGAGVPVLACLPPAAHVADGDDCDDGDAALSPSTPWYLDADIDGYGDPLAVTTGCTQPWAHVDNDLDCNDLDFAINPTTVWPYDGDGDGYGHPVFTVVGCDPPDGAPEATDCDDSEPTTSPGAVDVCDGIDNDCDGDFDDVISVTWYADDDGDGSGDPTSTIDDCAPQPGYVLNGDDCDDGDAFLNARDDDGDGVTACDADCDDADSSSYPGADDPCEDGVDQDCDGSDICILTWNGIASGVAVADLAGWELCYTGTYENEPQMTNVLAACDGDNLLIGCAPTGASELTLAAHAPREHVLFDMGELDATHDFNGVGWYYALSESWGFAEPGDGVTRSSCDTEVGAYPEHRMCWHTDSDQLTDGYRCGTTRNLYSSTWSRFIYQAEF